MTMPTYASSKEYLGRVRELLEGLPEPCERFVDALYKTFEEGRTVFLVGNGGSASAASHFAQDIAKGTLSSVDATRRFRVIALTDNIGYITALANDVGYDSVFEQQLRNLGQPGDLLIAISCSGNSKNVLRAVEYARSIEMKSIGITGFDGGTLATLVDSEVRVPVSDVGMAEALHSVVFHYAMSALHERLSNLEGS
jgi:D-sedoheptulose 7-phosphate isomerase